MFIFPLFLLIWSPSGYAPFVGKSALPPSADGPNPADSDPRLRALSLGAIALFVRCQDLFFRSVAKLDEENRIPWMMDHQTECFRGKEDQEFREYLGEFHEKMAKWNEKLREEKAKAEREQAVVYERIGRLELEPYQAEQPKMKLNLLSQVLRAQHLKMNIHFLDILVNGDGAYAPRGRLLQWIELWLKREGKVSSEVEIDVQRYQEKDKFDYFEWVANLEDPKQRISFDYGIEDFLETIMNVQMELCRTKVTWEDAEIDNFWTKGQHVPKVRRTLWLIRHPKRVDNQLYHKHLDPCLSAEGQQQVKEIAERFKSVPIDCIYSSPYKRTMELAVGLFGDSQQWHSGVGVRVEPGIAEFYKPCFHRFGFSDTSELANQFPGVDLHYRPVFLTKDLPTPKKNVADQREEQCNRVVEETLRQILEQNTNARHLVLVAHSGTIGLIHELLMGQWTAVGQATVSKFVQFEDYGGLSAGRGDDVLGHFRMEYSSDSSHLSERSNLQPY